MPRIAIIGAGFSGTLLALHLLRRCPAGTTITLIERDRAFGCGQAYSTGNPSHLLNVRVGGMSAFRDRPDHFLDWLNDSPHRYGEPQVQPGSFVPRRDFGTYIRALLDTELRRNNDASRLDLVSGEVTGIAMQAADAVLSFRDGRTLAADLAVLATGNVPALPPPVADPSFYDTAAYRPDPWAQDALTGLDPAAPILLIGTGLTAMDVVMSLLDQGHTGPIQALSRRGQLPQRHAGAPIFPPTHHSTFPATPLELLRRLRGDARAALAGGGDWRPVVDAIRPFTSDIWQLMPIEHRARFLRHLRPWWEVHRHRMAPAIADRIAATRASGQLSIHAGHILGYQPAGTQTAIAYRPRHATETATLTAARVINCSGPGADYQRITDPMVRSLLAQGLARPDALRLGLDVTANCALREASGAVSRHIFAVGPMTRSTFWEMTAVPDIRRQCELLAAHLGALLPAPAKAVSGVRPEVYVI